MVFLPDELLLWIMRLLPGRRVALLAAVCKQWWRVCRDPRAFAELTLAYSTPTPNPSRGHLPYCTALRELRIRWTEELERDFHDAPGAKVLPAAEQLTTLEVMKMPQSGWGGIFAVASVMWPSLAELVLRGQLQRGFPLRATIGGFAQLRVLQIHCMPPTSAHKPVQLSAWGLFHVLPAALEELVVRGVNYDAHCGAAMEALGARCPKLRVLELGGLHGMASHVAVGVSQASIPALRRLALCDGRVAVGVLVCLFMVLRDLEFIHFEASVGYDGPAARRRKAPPYNPRRRRKAGDSPREARRGEEIAAWRARIALWLPRVRPPLVITADHVRRADGGTLRVQGGQGALAARNFE